jgi:hypothetical protein
MADLKVKINNCYGIRQLDEEFKFDEGSNIQGKTKCYAIYASNGSMKSSFADTFYALQESIKGEPRDRMYPERKPVCNISWDGKPIDPKIIYVIKTIDDKAFDEPPAGATRLLVNEKLKKEYQEVYAKLQSEKDGFITKLKKISGSTDCELELLATFSGARQGDSIYEILERTASIVKDKKYQVYDFKYNDVFDKGGKVRDFVAKNKDLLQDYATTYNRLLMQSSFFSNESSFGTYQAKEIDKNVKDDGFFGAGHRFKLNGNDTEVESSKQFSEIIKNEIQRIISNNDARAVFDKIDAALQVNQNLRTFQSALNKDNSIAAKIVNYDDFKSEVWYGFLSEAESDLSALASVYTEAKPSLDKISKQAETEQEFWKDAVDEFNLRFKKLPFKLDVVNRRDVVLNSVAPTIDFVFDDQQEDGSKPTTIQDLKKALSHGEKRALYLLSIIFDIKARQADNEETLFVIDDAVDSFDYKNKYAIIQYLKDITDVDNFYTIILTHNFDFFRTIDSRGIVNYSDCRLAYKDAAKTTLQHMEDFRNPFKSWKMQLGTDQGKLIASIPFTRNIVEYTRGVTDDDYKKLSAMLHVKADSRSITVKDLNDILSKNFPDVILPTNGTDGLYELIISTASDYSTSTSELKLHEKIVLSVASRLIAESYARLNISDTVLMTLEDAENPTHKLFKAFKDEHPNSNTEAKNTLEEVLLMTPENIHLNAFMYEPIIDLGSDELRSLFEKVKRTLV